jgi:hypothetical protein
MTRNIEHVFGLVEEFVFADCGDGWGFIVSPEYEKLADYFEKWEKDNGNLLTHREDYPIEKFILFHQSEEGQEGISFLKDIPENYESMADSILVVLTWQPEDVWQ